MYCGCKSINSIYKTNLRESYVRPSSVQMMPSSCFSNGFVKKRSIITQAGCDKNQKIEKRLY